MQKDLQIEIVKITGMAIYYHPQFVLRSLFKNQYVMRLINLLIPSVDYARLYPKGTLKAGKRQGKGCQKAVKSVK
jgi:hypothetical protein